MVSAGYLTAEPGNRGLALAAEPEMGQEGASLGPDFFEGLILMISTFLPMVRPVSIVFSFCYTLL